MVQGTALIGYQGIEPEQPSIDHDSKHESKGRNEQNRILAAPEGAFEGKKSASALGITLLVAWLVGNATFGAPFSHIHVGPIYITEILLAFLLVLYTIQIANGRLQLPRNQSSVWLFSLIGAYLFYGVIRLLIGLLAGREEAFVLLRNFGLVHYALFALVGYFAVTGAPLGKRIVAAQWVILLSSTAANAIRMVFYFDEFGAAANSETKITGGDTVLYTLFSIIFVWVILQDEDRKSRRPRSQTLLLWGLLPLNFLFVWFSGHRSALIALAVSILAVQFSRGQFGKAIRLLAGGAIAMVLVAALAGDIGQSIRIIGAKYLTIASPMQEADSLWRALFWKAILHLWSQSPLFGVGFGYDFMRVQPFLTGTPGERGDPHNSYLAIGARMGAVGIGLIVVLFACYFLMVLRTSRRGDAQARALSSILLAEFVAVAAFASMNVTLEGPFEGGLLWMMIGMGMALLEHLPQRAAQSRYGPYRGLVAYAAAVACQPGTPRTRFTRSQ